MVENFPKLSITTTAWYMLNKKFRFFIDFLMGEEILKCEDEDKAIKINLKEVRKCIMFRITKAEVRKRKI
ncbi:MAG: hypothetical protein QW270_04370 [Candidatus Bathyarchaeia archaeon]